MKQAPGDTGQEAAGAGQRESGRRPVTEQITARLTALLDSGELAAGDRLPPERRLAEAFGVSRGTVREAIKALTEAGVLESRGGSGTYVISGRRDELLSVLLDSLDRSRRRLAEVMDVRLILEPRIAELAARRATPADVAQLRMLLICQRREIVAGGMGREADSAFHAALARIAGNSVLLDLVEGIADILSESRADYLHSEEHRMASLVAHERILEAVARGDGISADQAMRDHLHRMEEHFRSGDAGARPGAED